MDNKPMTVLVADDDPAVLSLMAEAMALDGWEVWQARDGDEAVEQALTLAPTAALLDVMLPGLTGTEVAEMLRDVTSLSALHFSTVRRMSGGCRPGGRADIVPVGRVVGLKGQISPSARWIPSDSAGMWTPSITPN